MIENILVTFTLLSCVTKNIGFSLILTLLALLKLALKLILVLLQAIGDILYTTSECTRFLRSILGTLFDIMLTFQEIIERNIGVNMRHIVMKFNWQQ